MIEPKLDAKLDAYQRMLSYALRRLRHHEVPGLRDDFRVIAKELENVGEPFPDFMGRGEQNV